MEGRVSYLESGISYLGTEERGGGAESEFGFRDVTWRRLDCQMWHCSGTRWSGRR